MSKLPRITILGFALAIVLLLFSTQASAMYTTYQAKIIKPDGVPLESTNVNFRFTILDPLGACILYTENFNTINMAGTGGLVYFSLGSGIKTFPVSASVNFSDVFNNYGAALSCASGGPPSYTPVVGDLRKIVMQFHDGSGWQTLPAMSINYVPYAMYAKNAASATTAVNSNQLNGKTDLDFVQVSAIPTCAASQALQFNGASFACVSVNSGGGGGGSMTVSGTAPIIVTGTVSSPQISISVASMSSDGYLTAVDYAEFKAKLSVSSTQITNTLGYAPVSSSAVAAQILSANLFGDVSGTVSSNSVASVGGKTASQISTSVNDTLAATSSNTVSTLVKRDSAGNFTANDIYSNTTKVNYFDIYKPSTSFNIRLQAPTSLAANHTLILPTSSGTSGQVLSTDGNGNLSWVNTATGSVTSVSATVPLSSTGGSTPTLSIMQATSSTNGYLSSIDWNTFNNKQNATSAAIIAALGYTPANSATIVSSQWSTSGATINYMAGNVGIGTTSPQEKLHVSGTMLVTGDWGAGPTLNVSGAGTRMFFYPRKAAFRGGYAYSNEWDENNIGEASFAFGDGAIASGSYSIAMGRTAQAFAPYAVALGQGQASGDYSTAFDSSVASGLYSVAMGSSSAQGDRAIAMGGSSSANGESSVAIGRAVISNSFRSVAVGSYNIGNGSGTAWIATDPIFEIGNSQNGMPRTNAMTVLKNGNVGVTVSAPTARLHLASGTNSLAPLKFTLGTLLTSPQSGTMEYDGFNFYITDSANTRKTIATGSSAGTIDNASNINSSANITMTPMGSVVVSSTTASTDSSTGAVVVKGGLGVAGNLNVAGIISGSAKVTATGFRANQGSPDSNDSSTNGYAFGTDGDTGMFSPGGGAANGVLAFYGNNAELMRITASGNVGIGTSVPTKTLDVAGDIKVNGIIFGRGGGGVNSGNIAIGDGASTVVNSGFSNIAIGEMAMNKLNDGYENLAIGAYVMYQDENNGSFRNTGIGHLALQGNYGGFENTAVGAHTLQNNSSGYRNTGLGVEALGANSTGIENTSIGYLAMVFNNSGSKNTTIGASVMARNLTGSNNTSIGHSAGLGDYTVSNFDNNTLIGFESGYSLRTAGSNNVLIGYKSAHNLATGNKNIVIGYDIDLPTTSSSQMLNIGNLIYATGLNGSGTTLSTGNIGVGTMSPVTKLSVSGGVQISMEAATCAASFAGTLRYNSGNVEFCNGTSWSALGVAGAGITLFNGSTSGTQSFANGTVGTAPAFVTANGVHTLNIPLASAGSVTAGLLSNADYTTFMGKITSSAASIAQVLGYIPANSATTVSSQWSTISGTAINYANGSIISVSSTQVIYLPNQANLTGSVAFGDGLRVSNNSGGSQGRYNTAVGIGALFSNTTGGYNVANGAGALYSNTTGSYNVANGMNALYSNTWGEYNVANGVEALYSNLGDFNVANGYRALYSNTTGSDNIAIGINALYNNKTGHYNVAMGSNALLSNRTKKESTAIGYQSMRYADSVSAAPVISYNTAIGAYSLYGSMTSSNNTGTRNTAIGHSSLMNATSGSSNTAIGYNAGSAITTGSNNVVIGSNDGSTIAMSSNNILIADGQGNERIRVISNGNVGIGTTTPAYKFSLYEGVGSVVANVESGNNGSAAYTRTTGKTSGGVTRTMGAGLNISDSNGNFELYDFTAGASRLYVNDAGFIGIGTTSPQDMLTVGNASGSIIRMDNVVGSRSWRLLSNNSSGIFAIRDETAATNRLSISTSGIVTVGLAVSAPAYLAKLSIADDGTATGDSRATVNVFNNRTTGSTSGRYSYDNAQGINFWEMSTDYIGNGGNNWYLFGGGTPRLYVDGVSGSVGVGTTAPTEKLHVQGNSKVGDTATTGTVYMQLLGMHDTAGGSGFRLQFDRTNDIFGIAREWSGFQSPSFVIKRSDGNVGIGTTSPNNRLEVNGNILANAGAIGTGLFNGSFTNNTNRSYMDSSGYFWSTMDAAAISANLYLHRNNTTQNYITFGYGVAAVGSVTTNGSSVSYNTTSDYRLKENITPMMNSVSRILKLQPKRFNYITTPDERVDGFIAHEVSQVVPEAVHGKKDAVDEKGNMIPQLVDYSKVVPVITGAVREIISELRGLASIVDSKADKAEIEMLKAENAKLKAYLCSKDPAAAICK